MWIRCAVFCVLFCLGHSSLKDLIPLEKPDNLTLIDFDDRDVIITWDPVDPTTVRGTFRGYLARVWNHALSQVYAIPPEITRTAVQFFPYSKNFITVAVRNDKFVGPRSNAISFDAPQTEPNMPSPFEYRQLGSNSVLLQWKKPSQPNGVLLGYNIYCSEMNGAMVNEKTTIKYFVSGGDNLQAKLTGLKEELKYFVQIGAVNCAGESDHKVLEVELKPHTSQAPSMSTFEYKIGYNVTDKEDLMKEKCFETYQRPFHQQPKTEDLVDDFYILNEQEKGQIVTPSPHANEWLETNVSCLVNTLIKWIPDVDNNPGEYFYVKYRTKNDEEYVKTAPQMDEDYVILENFNACINYEIILVAVDGEFETESEPQETPIIVFMFKRN
ncbi:neuroglian-like [Anoplophora glabripennis]|uniref:neuroglian-like n=1 Tax=Anoplophora glabripennis TaxID=217634 RepID=UPI00087490D6|nr:neuroglian-like [Anoplophora glabripennis]